MSKTRPNLENFDAESVSALGTSEPSALPLNASRTAAQGLAAAFAGQAALAVTGVLVARGLGPTDRGLFALIILVPFVFAQLGTLGLPLSATYAIARNPGVLSSIYALARRAIWIQSAVLVPPCAAITFALLGTSYGLSVHAAMVIAVAVVPLFLVHEYMMSIIQGARQMRPYYTLRTLPSILWLFGLLVAVLVGNLSLVVVSLCWTLSTAVTAVMDVVWVRRIRRDVSFDDQHPLPSLGSMIGFGIRGLFGSTPIVQAYRLDQMIVGVFLTPTALGHYVVAAGFTNLPLFVAIAIGATTYSETAHQRNRAAAKRTVWRYFWITSGISAFIVAATWFATPWLLPAVFGGEFRASVAITQVLLFNALFVSGQRVLIEGARGLGRPGLGSLSEVTLLVSLLLFAAVLVPAHGAIGLSWALVIASGIGFVVALLGVLAGSGEDAMSGRAGTSQGVAPRVE